MLPGMVAFLYKVNFFCAILHYKNGSIFQQKY